jgi:hypothetical protein
MAERFAARLLFCYQPQHWSNVKMNDDAEIINDIILSRCPFFRLLQRDYGSLCLIVFSG